MYLFFLSFAFSILHWLNLNIQRYWWETEIIHQCILYAWNSQTKDISWKEFYDTVTKIFTTCESLKLPLISEKCKKFQWDFEEENKEEKWENFQTWAIITKLGNISDEERFKRVGLNNLIDDNFKKSPIKNRVDEHWEINYYLAAIQDTPFTALFPHVSFSKEKRKTCIWHGWNRFANNSAMGKRCLIKIAYGFVEKDMHGMYGDGMCNWGDYFILESNISELILKTISLQWETFEQKINQLAVEGEKNSKQDIFNPCAEPKSWKSNLALYFDKDKNVILHDTPEIHEYFKDNRDYQRFTPQYRKNVQNLERRVPFFWKNLQDAIKKWEVKEQQLGNQIYLNFINNPDIVYSLDFWNIWYNAESLNFKMIIDIKDEHGKVFEK